MSEPVIGTPTPAADPTSDGWAAPPARVSVFRASVSEILAACREELAADRATVFFVEPDGAELCSFVIDGTDLSEIRVSTTRGVAAEVLQTGVPVAISDAYADPRFDPSIDQRSGYRTTRIACVPIVTRDGTRCGVVQLLNKVGPEPFSDRDLASLAAHADRIAKVVDDAARWRVLLPGLAAVTAIALTARGIHGLLPDALGSVLDELLIAIGIGLVGANLFRIPANWAPGMQLAIGKLLKIAIVLLGARMALDQVLSTGARALVFILIVMAIAFAVAHLTAALLRVPVRLATLIAVGVAICGNTAIAALAPVIRAQDEEVSFAIAVNTLFGTLALLTFPLLGHAFAFTDPEFGTWAGTAVNDTSQVVATGFAFSERAGEIATVVKLTRNALMVFAIVGVGLVYAQLDKTRIGGVTPSWRRRITTAVPGFVLWFLVLAMVNSLGWIDALSALAGVDVGATLIGLCKVLILVALSSVALSTNFSRAARTGLAPVWVGLITMCCTTTASLLLIHWLGPVGA